MDQKTSLNLDPKLARVLCYALGWVTGLIFYFVEENKNIRFHAMQSIIAFGVITILLIGISLIGSIVLLAVSFIGFLVPIIGALIGVINLLIGLGTLLLWLYCLLNAYQDADFRLPVIADNAEKFVS